MSPRPGPQPNLPDGCYSALSANDYHKHDARRLVRTPISIENNQLLISAKDRKSTIEVESVAPGRVYKPQLRKIVKKT